MKREELIKKWLDNELNAQEFEAFKALEDYEALTKLSDGIELFKAPEYNTSEELNTVMHSINTRSSQSSTPWTKYILRIAAVLLLSFSIYYYTTTLDTHISTLASEKTYVELPDASQVTLNALSALSYNKRKWKKERDIALDGEAYFKVATGETFNVLTSVGVITVLGTEFNVKQRNELFEVVCYEGAVRVTYQNDTNILKPGDSFLILNGKLIATEKESATNPSWINNESYFKSMPFGQVISEFERQYNISIDSADIDLEQLFTGSFVHNNLALALKSITLPLNLKYLSKDNSTIVLTRE